MENQETPIIWETYIADHPNDYAQLRQMQIFQALLNSLQLEHERIKNEIALSTVVDEKDVADFNSNQGALLAIRKVLEKLVNPLPDTEPEETEESDQSVFD